MIPDKEALALNSAQVFLQIISDLAIRELLVTCAH